MQERIQFSIGNIAIIVTKVRTTENKHHTLHRDKRKGVLKAKLQSPEVLQELAVELGNVAHLRDVEA